METGLQEAKLLDEEDQTQEQGVVLLDEDEEELTTVDGETVHDDPEESAIRQNVKQAAPVSDHSELSTSLAVLQKYKSAGESKLLAALESLADLAHEIDFGTVIVDSANLKNLMAIVQDSKSSPATRETAVRTIGASLRNNPEAVKLTLGSKVTESLLKTLHELNKPGLSRDSASNKLVGRLVYALGSIVSTGEADPTVYGESDHAYISSNGGDVLRQSFQVAGPDVQQKIATFVSDRALSPVWPITELRYWSSFLQKELSEGKLTESAKESVLDTLVRMHEFAVDQPHGEQQTLRKRDHAVEEEELKVQDSFLNWLVKQADTASDKETKQSLLRARHEVFGNPLARRKNFDDL